MPGDERASQRVVYVIPPEATMPSIDREIDLLATVLRLWQGRRWIFGATVLAIAAAVAYLAVTPPWYRAEAVLMPAQGRSVPSLPGALAGLSGIAGLAGITIGGGGTAEPLAVLTSNDFTRDFVRKHELIPTLFAEEWDAERAAWKAADVSEWPDERDAVKRFDEQVRRVYEDKRTGKVRLAVEWTDPEIAAIWANAMVDDLNDRMRERALQEAEVNLAYLRRELDGTSLVTLQQSIGRLIESEIQKAMLAKGEREFSFRVIDRAAVPKWRAGPRRAMVLALSAVAGAALGVLLVLLRSAFSRRAVRHDGERTDRQAAGT
jgi:uncharacterized protein involved in exopolysaccharide biosynthesis